MPFAYFFLSYLSSSSIIPLCLAFPRLLNCLCCVVRAFFLPSLSIPYFDIIPDSGLSLRVLPFILTHLFFFAFGVASIHTRFFIDHLLLLFRLSTAVLPCSVLPSFPTDRLICYRWFLSFFLFNLVMPRFAKKAKRHFRCMLGSQGFSIVILSFCVNVWLHCFSGLFAMFQGAKVFFGIQILIVDNLRAFRVF